MTTGTITTTATNATTTPRRRKTAPPASSFGVFVRRERRRQGLSQLDLALRAGCSQTYLCNAEAGVQPVSANLATKIADALGANRDVLLFLSGRVPPDLLERPIQPEHIANAINHLREVSR